MEGGGGWVEDGGSGVGGGKVQAPSPDPQRMQPPHGPVPHRYLLVGDVLAVLPQALEVLALREGVQVALNYLGKGRCVRAHNSHGCPSPAGPPCDHSFLAQDMVPMGELSPMSAECLKCPAHWLPQPHPHPQPQPQPQPRALPQHLSPSHRTPPPPAPTPLLHLRPQKTTGHPPIGGPLVSHGTFSRT